MHGKYVTLMTDFSLRNISIEEFERQYLDMFKNEPLMDETIFNILNAVFNAVDSYWHECEPGQETEYEISEQQLRKEVSEALMKFNEIGDRS